MTIDALSNKMEGTLKSQINLVDEIYALQKKIYNYVLKRDWADVKIAMDNLDNLSEKFKLADEQMVLLINADSKTVDPCKNLNEAMKKFPSGKKAEIKNLCKTLKEKLYLSKIENDVFNNYIDHTRNLVASVFDIVSENRAGQTYTRTGNRADSDLSNVLVNRVF